MKEILFRGKRVGNGKWVEGCFSREYGSNEIITADDETYHITPDTLGEYTTVKDKNGTRIFEGDVVKLFDIAIGEIVCEYGAFGISCRQQIDYDYLASEIASITGCDNTPMFCRNDNFVSLWELYWNYNQESSEISVIEVIGNVHDGGAYD